MDTLQTLNYNIKNYSETMCDLKKIQKNISVIDTDFSISITRRIDSLQSLINKINDMILTAQLGNVKIENYMKTILDYINGILCVPMVFDGHNQVRLEVDAIKKSLHSLMSAKIIDITIFLRFLYRICIFDLHKRFFFDESDFIAFSVQETFLKNDDILDNFLL